MANETERTPAEALGEKIIEMGRRELCELVISLCGQIQDQVGTDCYRGGVYPGNIRMTDEGPVLGPAAEADWQGEELCFLAPELYWKGERTPAGDVYSLGLLLYYAADSGRLPFYRDGMQAAAQRRLKGDSFPPPRAAGRRLGEIISKATAFRAAERYQTVAELKAVLQTCVDMYLGGAPGAEDLFQKDGAELSRVERMMVSILQRDAAAAEPEESRDEPVRVEEEKDQEITEAAAEPEAQSAPEQAEPAPEEEAPAAGEEPAPVEEEASAAAEEPETESEPVPPAEPKAEAPREPIPILEVEENPELEPVVIDWPAAEIRYGTNVERERKIAETVRKRRRRPVLGVLLLCLLLLGAALIFNTVNARRDPNRGAPVEPTPIPAQGGVAATPDGTGTTPGPEAETTPEPEATPEPLPESTYHLYIDDVSWTEARDRCVEQGGHLVVISDRAEFDKVVAMAETYGVDMVWVGCRRIEGELRWVTDEEVGFWPWGENEPSYVDSYDDVAEDYVLLWKVGDSWCYNDSRNDPIAYYPAAYSGRIAFICEIEG